jgi:hypothetical protein
MGGRGASYNDARNIIGQYSISDITSSKNKIVSFYSTMNESGGIRIEDGRIKVKRAAAEQAQALARYLAGKIYVNDEMSLQDYRSLKKALSGTYTISKQDRSNIADFSSYLRQNKNVKIGKSGMSLDSKYQELASQYPQYFNARRETNPADQLQRINSVMKSLKNSRIKISKEEQGQAAKEMAQDIIRAYAYRKMKRQRA